MMQNTMQTQIVNNDQDMAESISASMDNQLDDAALNQLIHSHRQDINQTWAAYHVIGDVLRQTPFKTSNMATKINQLLIDEPTVLAPQPRRTVSKFVMPMTAAIAAVMLVSWSALNVPTGTGPVPIQTVATTQIQPDKIDQVRLADFIAAHRDYSPGATSPLVNANYQVTTERSR